MRNSVSCPVGTNTHGVVGAIIAQLCHREPERYRTPATLGKIATPMKLGKLLFSHHPAACHRFTWEAKHPRNKQLVGVVRVVPGSRPCLRKLRSSNQRHGPTSH